MKKKKLFLPLSTVYFICKEQFEWSENLVNLFVKLN